MLKVLCDSSRWPSKALVLILFCCIQGSTMFSVECISGLNNSIIEIMKIDGTQYELLFSGPTWPSIALCLVGGVIIDNVTGVKFGFIMGVCLSLCGGILTSIGAFINQFIVMLIGRYVLGIGEQFQLILLNVYMYSWFGDRGISFAVSVNLTVAKVIGASALIAMQYLLEEFDFLDNLNCRLGATLLIGVLVQLCSLIAVVLVVILSKSAGVLHQTSPQKIKLKKRILEILQNMKRVITVDLFLVTTAIGVYVPIVYIFTSVGQQYLMLKYDFPIHEASVTNSLVLVGVAVVNPFIGALISGTGLMLYWGGFGIILGLASHWLYVFTTVDTKGLVYLASIIYSLSFSVFVISTIGIPGKLVEKEQLSTAYGFMKAIDNLGFAMISLVTGIIIDSTGYFIMEVFNEVLIMLTFVALLWLFVRNNNLNILHRKLTCLQTEMHHDASVTVVNSESI